MAPKRKLSSSNKRRRVVPTLRQGPPLVTTTVLAEAYSLLDSKDVRTNETLTFKPLPLPLPLSVPVLSLLVP